MRLHGKGPVAIDQRGILAERIAARDLRAGRQGHDLILVPGVQRDGLAAEIVILRAHGPTAGMLDHRATQGLRDDLMTKADADHRHARIVDAADEILQRRDEGVILIGPVARTGQQPAVGIVDVLWKLHPLDMPGGEVESAPGQQAHEHVRIVAQIPLQLRRRLAALKDADPHEKP